LKQISTELVKVNYKHGEFDQFSNLNGYIIYCDPPYSDTHQNYYNEFRKHNTKFNYEDFTKWCVEMARHNVVLVSEYNKPKCRCKCIYKRGSERLFLIS
jgi:site-specific DNA-adenine methylase